MNFSFTSLIFLSLRRCGCFILISLCVLLAACCVHAAPAVTGLWTTIDDKTNQPKSVVYIYEYNNEIYGRVMKLFKNKDQRMTQMKGSPLIVGSDIIWGLQGTGKRYTRGKILDPKSEKIYSAEIWRQGDNLIVRGKIGPFGRNQTWIKNTDETLLPATAPVPVIPQLK